jgi:SAM-dependent methyltransferase
VSFLAIATTIIVTMVDEAQLVSFYEDAYSRAPRDAALYGRWRALGAGGKADHVIALCGQAACSPASTLEVGCGDGALLCELRRRGFGGRLSGLEIAPAAVSIARDRPEIDSVDQFDGLHIPAAEDTYELGILSHVLEHVPQPAALLAEVGRTCGAVIVEVPLEDNLSARRSAKQAHAEQVGHLQRLDRGAARAIVAQAGLTIACELEDPLPLAVHQFFAAGRAAGVAAGAKWALRAGLHRTAPGLARRIFTLHYACLCVPAA